MTSEEYYIQQKIDMGNYIGKFFNSDNLLLLKEGLKIGHQILKDNGCEEIYDLKIKR